MNIVNVSAHTEIASYWNGIKILAVINRRMRSFSDVAFAWLSRLVAMAFVTCCRFESTRTNQQQPSPLLWAWWENNPLSWLAHLYALSTGSVQLTIDRSVRVLFSFRVQLSSGVRVSLELFSQIVWWRSAACHFSKMPTRRWRILIFIISYVAFP